MDNKLNVFTYGYLPVNWNCLINIFRNIKQFFVNLRSAWERSTKGYCKQDVWNLNDYTLLLMRDCTNYLANHSYGYPGREDIDTPEKWKNYLLTMSNLFDRAIDREFDDFQYYKNPYEQIWEESLRNSTEWKKYESLDGEVVYVPDNNKERTTIFNKYMEAEKHIDELRKRDRECAFKMFLNKFEDMWD